MFLLVKHTYIYFIVSWQGLKTTPWWLSGKESACQCRKCRFDPWRRGRLVTPVFLPGKSHGQRSLVGCSPWGRWSWTRLSDFTFTFHFHALEKEMATHSSVLAWRIPGTGKPGGLPSMESHRVRHDWSDLAAAAAAGNKLTIHALPASTCLCVDYLLYLPETQT